MILNKEQIKEIIPHRDPFLLIDGIAAMDSEAGTITAVKYVSEEEYYFKGHFPAEPVMPGVLIVESLAQAGAVSILNLDRFKGKTAYFGGIKNAKFRNKVVPGDVLELTVNLEKLGSRAGSATAKAVIKESAADASAEGSKKEKVACECEIMFVIG